MNKVIMKNLCSVFGRIIPVAMTFLIFAIFGCQKQGEETVSLDADNTMTVEKAIDEVNAFLKEIEPVVTRSYGESRRVVSSWVKSLDKGASPSDAMSPKLYILNFDDSKGFAIVSNDPRKGVLGLALSGTYEEDEPIDNPGFAIIMEQLEKYARIPTRVDSIDHYEYGQWQNVYYAPNTGYCPVKWSQGSYSGNQFNAYCPVINGIRCPAGCDPVAVAQLMSMYKYPSSYGAYAFNWNSMIANSTATDNYGNYYVGRLLQQIGLSQNLNVNYGVNGSGANPADIPQTLENFGYADGGTFGYLYTYNAIQDLKNGYPIIIRGETASGMGHGWLAHGVYDRTREYYGYSISGEILDYGSETIEYILHNFGWGGTADGYYLLNNYDTTQGPSYYDPTMPFHSTGSSNFVNDIMSVYGIRRY